MSTDDSTSTPLLSRRRWVAATLLGATLLWWRPWDAAQSPSSAVNAHLSPFVAEKSATAPANVLLTIETPPERTPDPPAARFDRCVVLGVWKDQFYGERTMTFRDDGTATMVLALDSVGQLLYGPQITFTLDWTLDADVLHLRMTGGEPKDSAESLSRFFGKTSEQRIEQATDTELQLRSLDSQKLYVHRRAPTD
jgi:hypothetical protein